MQKSVYTLRNRIINIACDVITTQIIKLWVNIIKFSRGCAIRECINNRVVGSAVCVITHFTECLCVCAGVGAGQWTRVSKTDTNAWLYVNKVVYLRKRTEQLYFHILNQLIRIKKIPSYWWNRLKVLPLVCTLCCCACNNKRSKTQTDLKFIEVPNNVDRNQSWMEWKQMNFTICNSR